MKKNLKLVLGLSFLVCVLVYIGNYILWGIGMGTIHSPGLSNQEKTFIHDFNQKYPKINFYFKHSFDSSRPNGKNEPAKIILEPLNPQNEFKKWPEDSLLAFGNQLNADFQRVLNYKQAYDSLHLVFLNYDNRIIYKEYSNPVK